MKLGRNNDTDLAIEERLSLLDHWSDRQDLLNSLRSAYKNFELPERIAERLKP